MKAYWALFRNNMRLTMRDRGVLFFRPNGPGFSRVTVIDSAGATATAVVRVDDGSAAKLTAR